MKIKYLSGFSKRRKGNYGIEKNVLVKRLKELTDKSSQERYYLSGVGMKGLKVNYLGGFVKNFIALPYHVVLILDSNEILIARYSYFEMDVQEPGA